MTADLNNEQNWYQFLKENDDGVLKGFRLSSVEMSEQIEDILKQAQDFKELHKELVNFINKRKILSELIEINLP